MSVHSDVCLRGYRSQLPHLVLQDLSIHHLDLIRYLSGQECESLYVRDWPSVEAGVEISATTDMCAILNMTGPVTVCYTASLRRLLDHVGYVCAARIAGSEGELVLGDDKLTLTCSGDNIKSLEVLFAAIESAETGAVVALGGVGEWGSGGVEE